MGKRGERRLEESKVLGRRAHTMDTFAQLELLVYDALTSAVLMVPNLMNVSTKR